MIIPVSGRSQPSMKPYVDRIRCAEYYISCNGAEIWNGRNDELIHIGHASARLDDICNFIPSRLAALMMIMAALVLRLDFKGAVRIFRRDRLNHLSPNSAQT